MTSVTTTTNTKSRPVSTNPEEHVMDQHSADRLAMAQTVHQLAATLAKLARTWEDAEYSAPEVTGGAYLAEGYPFGELDLADLVERTQQWADRLSAAQ